MGIHVMRCPDYEGGGGGKPAPTAQEIAAALKAAQKFVSGDKQALAQRAAAQARPAAAAAGESSPATPATNASGLHAEASAKAGAATTSTADARRKWEAINEAKGSLTIDEWMTYTEETGEDHYVTNLVERCPGTAANRGQPLGEARLRLILSDAAAFLHQVITLTATVLESVRPAQLREIVGSDLALPECILRGDKTVSLKETPALDRDGRKNPRGRKHPLVALIELAAKSAKLLEKIGAGLCPQALDREPLSSRLQNRAQEREARLEIADKRMWAST
jgi:hypothetical protein